LATYAALKLQRTWISPGGLFCLFLCSNGGIFSCKQSASFWGARRRLSETEILRLLKPPDLPQLPPAVWSLFRASGAPILVTPSVTPVADAG
jgi:hypothetical protein